LRRHIWTFKEGPTSRGEKKKKRKVYGKKQTWTQKNWGQSECTGFWFGGTWAKKGLTASRGVDILKKWSAIGLGAA